jgi:hypothetical protein
MNLCPSVLNSLAHQHNRQAQILVEQGASRKERSDQCEEQSILENDRDLLGSFSHGEEWLLSRDPVL